MVSSFQCLASTKGEDLKSSLFLRDETLDLFPCVSAHLAVLPVLCRSQQLLKHLRHALREPNAVLPQEQAVVAQERPQRLRVPEEQTGTLSGTPHPHGLGKATPPAGPSFPRCLLKMFKVENLRSHL